MARRTSSTASGLLAGSDQATQRLRELAQRTPVYFTLEIHDLIQRVPVAYPLPVIELGLGVVGEADAGIVGKQPEQIPFLLLANAHRLLTFANIALWQAVAEPAPGAGDDIHGGCRQANLFFELTIERVFRLFPGADAALRKLPGIAPANATRPE